MSDFWEKFEKNVGKAGAWMQKEFEKKEGEIREMMRKKSDNEIIRISQNPDLPEFQRGLVKDEMRRRGL